MRLRAALTGVMPLTALAIVRTDTTSGAMAMKPNSETMMSEWSAPERGVSGRLHVELEDLDVALRHAVYLELRNDSLEPIAVTDQPRIEARLTDEAGPAIKPSGLPMSGPIPNPQWAVIPRGAVLRLRIDMQTVGAPERKSGKALVAVGGHSWALAAGKYLLRLRVLLERKAGAPVNQWVGELTLPPVAVMITPEMLAAH
jgi:hypothetical protein